MNYIQRRKPGQTLKEIYIKQYKKYNYLIKLGIEGEEITAKVLESLGNDYKVLHSIPLELNKKDLDHIIVGPTGVFLVNSKNYRSKSLLIDNEYIIYNKKRYTDPIDIRRDSDLVEKLFKIKVNPILCLINNNNLKIKSSNITKVLHVNKILDYIEKKERIYSNEQVIKIYNEMSNIKKWGITSLIDPDTVEKKYREKIAYNDENYTINMKTKINKKINEKLFGILLALVLGTLGAHRLYYKMYKSFFIGILLLMLSIIINILYFIIISWIIIDIILIANGLYTKKENN
jgi:hypothetical protein